MHWTFSVWGRRRYLKRNPSKWETHKKGYKTSLPLHDSFIGVSVVVGHDWSLTFRAIWTQKKMKIGKRISWWTPPEPAETPSEQNLKIGRTQHTSAAADGPASSSFAGVGGAGRAQDLAWAFQAKISRFRCTQNMMPANFIFSDFTFIYFKCCSRCTCCKSSEERRWPDFYWIYKFECPSRVRDFSYQVSYDKWRKLRLSIFL